MMFRKTLAVLMCAVLAFSSCASSDLAVSVTGQLRSQTVSDAAGRMPTSDDSNSADSSTSSSGDDTQASPELLPIDPQVRVGALANGLTYYVRSNASPGGALSLRLAVNAGSLNEPFAGAGYAHYLEHMLFNGTAKYPGNEITQVLQDIGVEFGPDINAYTSFDETVYMLDIVIDEQEESVDTAFEVLAEWAHAATITPEDTEEERGIIRDEYRLRVETGEGVISTIFNDIYTANTPYEGRSPIGTVENIQATTAQDLRDFYERWYVPSNMAVIAVGDLDTAELESLVQQHFGNLASKDTPPIPANYSAIQHDLIVAHAITPEQSYPYLSLDIRLPFWNPSTVFGNRQLWIEEIIAQIVNNRLEDAYEQGFLSQIDKAFWITFSHTRGLRYNGTNLRAENLSEALTDYWSLLLSLAEQGFDQADFDRAARVIAARLQAEFEAAPTRQDVGFASVYVEHFLEGKDISAPQDRLERITALLAELQVAELTERYREILATSKPIIIGVAPTESALPSTAELQAALQAATPGALPEQVAEIVTLTDPLEPALPVSQGTIEFLADELDDPYEWTFANGTRVLYAYSDIAKNEVSLEATGFGGWSVLPQGEGAIAQYLSTRAVNASGLGNYSRGELDAFLSERVTFASAYIGENTEGVAGSTNTAGTEVLFQLLHLYFTEPRVDEQAFIEAVSFGEILRSWAASDPGVQEYLATLQARHGDAFGWYNLVPTKKRLAELTAEELLEIYQSRFGGVDDLIVIVVGDVERDVVADLAQRYVGTLPNKQADTFVDRSGTLPEGVVRDEVFLGPDNRSTRATYIYETSFEPTAKQLVAARVLNVIINTQLVKSVREDLGNTYSAEALVLPRIFPRPIINTTIVATGDPEQMPQVEAEILRIVNELHLGQITSEEFTQALSVIGDDLEFLDDDMIFEMLFTWGLVGTKDTITYQQLIAALDDLTLSEVQEVAALALNPNQHIQIVRVLPEQ